MLSIIRTSCIAIRIDTTVVRISMACGIKDIITTTMTIDIAISTTLITGTTTITIMRTLTIAGVITMGMATTITRT